MRITEVTYRELVSGPGYNHIAKEVRAVVDDGETPEQAMERAKWWVRNQLADERVAADTIKRLYYDKAKIEAEIRNLERKRQQRIAELSLVTRWRVLRRDLSRWWAKLRRKEWYDPDLDDVPF
jgi:hypothetical protein